jgi:hypothetical protein
MFCEQELNMREKLFKQHELVWQATQFFFHQQRFTLYFSQRCSLCCSARLVTFGHRETVEKFTWVLTLNVRCSRCWKKWHFWMGFKHSVKLQVDVHIVPHSNKTKKLFLCKLANLPQREVRWKKEKVRETLLREKKMGCHCVCVCVCMI